MFLLSSEIILSSTDSRLDSAVPQAAEFLDAQPLSKGKTEKKNKKKKKKSKKKKLEQTEPPTIGLSKLFPDGKFPEGELQEYKNECVSISSISHSHAEENARH